MIAPSNEVPPGPCAVGRYSHHVTAAINVTLLWSFQFDCPKQDNVALALPQYLADLLTLFHPGEGRFVYRLSFILKSCTLVTAININ